MSKKNCMASVRIQVPPLRKATAKCYECVRYGQCMGSESYTELERSENRKKGRGITHNPYVDTDCTQT